MCQVSKRKGKAMASAIHKRTKTRYKNLLQSVFVTGLGNFINILNSAVSGMLVDSSAPRVNLLINYSFMTVPVSMSLLTADYNSSNMVPDKYVSAWNND